MAGMVKGWGMGWRVRGSLLAFFVIFTPLPANSIWKALTENQILPGEFVVANVGSNCV